MLEMQNTLNAIGDYPDTEDEDTDNETAKTSTAPDKGMTLFFFFSCKQSFFVVCADPNLALFPNLHNVVIQPASSRTTQPEEKKKKKKKKSKGASKKPNIEDYENANALDAADDPYDT